MNLFRKKSVQQILQQVKEGDESIHGGLKKHLRVRDLTAFGIAAIIGAGIFSTIGKASADGGPAVILLFIFTAIACGFAAFCYAEFSSMVPVSGSAYTYSYVAFGELFAWIIGWALIMEYAIGNIVVAISWSGYFSTLLTHIQLPGFPTGIHLPEWSGIDYFSAKRAFINAAANPTDIQLKEAEGYLAWISAPVFGGIKFILDIPAILINILITWLVYRGMRETRNASNIMVAIKLIVVFMVICLGAAYVNPENWSPFMPQGLGGVLAGVSAVFFAYIGFDAISTTAEECHNPQRDLPRGMMYSIIICTILYVFIALVLTGMVNYQELAVSDPLAFVFSRLGLNWISGIIAVSAVVAMASVLLVFQLGQPRIWMSMSRDGLLPKAFSRVHPRFGTPSFATIITGLLVGIPILFIDLDTVVDLCSIGTLFAFILVCGGVLMLQNQKDIPRKFRVPYFNGKFIVPLLLVFALYYCFNYQQQWLLQSVNPFAGIDAVPMFIFFVVFIIMAFYSFTRNLSLIPVAGILTCLYLMAQIHVKNWVGFTVWLFVGLVIYFSYSYKNSRLNPVSKK
jgi:basic amino acid/polyamine antiporter, APA family